VAKIDVLEAKCSSWESYKVARERIIALNIFNGISSIYAIFLKLIYTLPRIVELSIIANPCKTMIYQTQSMAGFDLPPVRIVGKSWV